MGGFVAIIPWRAFFVLLLLPKVLPEVHRYLV